MVVFEGEPEGPGQMSAYRPASDEWRAIEPVPVVVDTRAPRPFALWTESEVLLVSGQNVAAWDPEGDLWRTFEFPAALDADAAEQRLGTAQALLDSAIWTGDEVIVHWAVDDRWFALEPTTGTWRELPPAPSRLYSASAVWTGTEMIVVGAGHDTRALPPDPSSQPRLDAMAFEPNSDAWRSLPSASMDPQMTSAAWTGDDLVVVSYQGATLSYDTVTSSWLEGATLSPYALGGWVAALDVVDGRVVVSIPGGSLAQLTEDWEDFAPIVSSANRVGVADGFMYVVGTLQDDDESPRSFLALEVSELAN